MKLFKVPAGTKGYLIVEDPAMPALRPWTVRKDMIFQREDIAADPITQANGQDSLGIRTLGYNLVANGYSIFYPPRDCSKAWSGGPKYPKPKYMLVVPFGAVEVL
jgi:hypothetical protein